MEIVKVICIPMFPPNSKREHVQGHFGTFTFRACTQKIQIAKSESSESHFQSQFTGKIYRKYIGLLLMFLLQSLRYLARY